MVLMLLSDARTDPNGSDALVGCQGDPNGSDALVGCQGQGGSKWFRCSCRMPGGDPNGSDALVGCQGGIQMVQMLL